MCLQGVKKKKIWPAVREEETFFWLFVNRFFYDAGKKGQEKKMSLLNQSRICESVLNFDKENMVF